MSLVVTISKSAVLNANQRLHWRVKADRTRIVRAIVNNHAASFPRLGRTHLTITVAFSDRRERDVHNWMPTAKAAVDGLVDAGIWPNDSTAYLVGPDLRVDPETCPRGQIRLTFHFESLEDA